MASIFYKTHNVDANQPDIIADLEEAGATVQDLSAVGKGCADLLVGFRGVNYLLEIKNIDGLNRIRKSQKEFRERWRGQYDIVRTSEEALRAIGAVE